MMMRARDRITGKAAPPSAQPRRRLEKAVVLVAFSLVALFLDSTVPDGFSGNILYILPIIYAHSLGFGSPILWATAGTVLSVISSSLAPPGLPITWEVADRALTIAVLWGSAFLVLQLERRRSEARAAQHAAEEANLRKSRFLAAASHDLRQPAQSLTLFAGVLRVKAAGTNLEGVVAPLEEAIQGLNGMLTGLLDLSRLDAGVVRPKPMPVDVNEMLERLEAAYTLLAAEKGLRFRLRSQPGVRVVTDPELLERILRNLLDNAFKYTESGFVTLRCARRGANLVFRVTDSGHGIPSEHQDKIFEEFFQVGNDERDRSKGLGIGLSVVQRLVQMIGGCIKVHSRHGRGSQFTVILPTAA